MSLPFRSDPLDELSIPDGTTVEEHDVVTDGDVFVGGQSRIDLGVRGHNVVAGERVRFGGDIEAEGDCRLDMWCDVEGNVLVGEDAYLGERVHIGGQLMVSGDLDIGDDVDVEEGFEANGWIVIRNPMPTVVFLFVYLTHLLRMGESEEAERVAEEVLAGESREAEPLLVPRGARVSDDAWRVSTPAVVGDDCRLHGNIRAESVAMGADNELFGSLRAQGDITVGPETVIHGDVTTRGGDVSVDGDAVVKGDVSGEDVTIHAGASVEGSIRARGETRIGPEQPPAGSGASAGTAEARTNGASGREESGDGGEGGGEGDEGDGEGDEGDGEGDEGDGEGDDAASDESVGETDDADVVDVIEPLDDVGRQTASGDEGTNTDPAPASDDPPSDRPE